MCCVTACTSRNARSMGQVAYREVAPPVRCTRSTAWTALVTACQVANRTWARLWNVASHAGSVGQEEPFRANECLCVGQASLCPTIVSNRLTTPFVTLRSREVDEGFYRVPRDAERDGAEAGGDA